MKDEADRRAIFSFAVGYFDGEKDHIFVANEEGFIVDEPRGDNLHGWTELLYIYGHPSFPGRSLAELNDEEWQEYLTIIEKVDGLAMLRDYLIDVITAYNRLSLLAKSLISTEIRKTKSGRLRRLTYCVLQWRD